jgi:hypothetical protein
MAFALIPNMDLSISSGNNIMLIISSIILPPNQPAL